MNHKALAKKYLSSVLSGKAIVSKPSENFESEEDIYENLSDDENDYCTIDDGMERIASSAVHGFVLQNTRKANDDAVEVAPDPEVPVREVLRRNFNVGYELLAPLLISGSRI